MRTPPGGIKTRSKRFFFLDESKGAYHLVKNEWFYLCPLNLRLKHFDLNVPPQTFCLKCGPSNIWLKCAPSNILTLMCPSKHNEINLQHASFICSSPQYFDMRKSWKAEFSKNKKQGTGAEHTKFFAVNNQDFSWSGLISAEVVWSNCFISEWK